MVQSTLFQFDNDIAWQQVGPGVARKVLGYDDKLMMVKVKFEEGARGELHSHPHAQTSYVESGSFEMTMGDEVRIINAGDAYYVPPFTLHGCLCLQEGMLVDAFSPVRWDFLDTNADNYTL